MGQVLGQEIVWEGYMSKLNLKKSDVLDHLGITAIGLYALGSVLFGSDFSEIHLSVSFLSFPIFVGEILTVFCLAVLYLRHRYKPVVWLPWQQCVWVYLVLVVVRALWDFGHWGPYAFRNAAMFYYPVFILFGTVFYNPRYFSPLSKVLTALVLGALASIFLNSNYYWFSCVVFFVIIARRVAPRLMRLAVIAAFVLFCNYRLWFAGSRTNLMGSVAGSGFLFYVYVRYFLNTSWQKKAVLGAVLFFVLALSVIWFGDKNGMKSLVKIREAVDIYRQYKAIIEHERNHYVPRVLKTGLYHDNRREREIRKQREMARAIQQKKEPVSMPLAVAVKESPVAASQPSGKSPDSLPTKRQPQEIAPKQDKTDLLNMWVGKLVKTPDRMLINAQNNMIFRIFIWEDMFRELIQKRAWLGVGFGEPQRSPSLEILGWGETEWSRDGWITPHNAYFHIIYRLGILGLGLIIILVFALKHVTRRFIAQKSMTGILLVSILIYWFATANSLVILELPHYAIPVWAVFGLALAYADALRRHHE